MIVTCEQCTTQFQLDDAKVPARGVRVRCSRCKHAFFVKPHVEAGRAVERAVEHALDDDTAAVRSAHEDLLVGSAGTRGGGVSPLDEAGEESVSPLDEAGEESDWEFNHDPEPAADDIGGPLEVDLSADEARDAVDDLLDAPDIELDAAGDLVPDIGDEVGHDLGNDVDSPLAAADDAPGLASDSGFDLRGEPPTDSLHALGEADVGHDELGPASLDGGPFPAETDELESAAQGPPEFDLFESGSSDAADLEPGPLADADLSDRLQSDGSDPGASSAPGSLPSPKPHP